MKKILIKISAFFMLALLAVGFSPSAFTLARAESVYTTVMQDLEKGEVNEADYPVNNKDYTITLFQIAEGVNGELFVYTYQPCQMSRQLVATSINMGLSENLDEEINEDDISGGSNAGGEVSGDDGGGLGGSSGGGGGGGGSRPASLVRTAPTTKLYDLKLVSSQTVFCKYLVKDFHVSKDAAVRYYNITSIYREYITGIDEPTTGASQTVNEVAFPVGKLFTATTEGGNIVYDCENRKTVEIINPYARYLRYTDGFFLKTTACDSHFVAFSTDWKIDELYEADVSYKARSVHQYYNWLAGIVTDYGEYQSEYAYLTDEQEYHKEPTGWLWGTEKKYSRIQSVEEFIATETINEEMREDLKGKKWVLRFAETDFSHIYDGSDCGDTKLTEVSNVTVLRLKFKSAGKVYNLGAVSDKVTGPINRPGNPDEQKPNLLEQFFAWLENVTGVPAWVWKMIAILIPIAILMPILAAIFPVVGVVLKWLVKGIGYLFYYLFKVLWWLISAPFRLIAYIVKRRKGKKEKSE